MTLYLFLDGVVHRQGAPVSSDRHRQFSHLLSCVGGSGRRGKGQGFREMAVVSSRCVYTLMNMSVARVCMYLHVEDLKVHVC